MPNGNPKFHEELPALESFFGPIAAVLNEFASAHNLMLVRYYHDLPSWRFNFRHPQGGVASLDVIKWSDDSIKIHLCWWVDDYDKFTRFIKDAQTDELKIDEVNLAAALEEALRTIISWRAGEWTQVATGNEPYWGEMGKEWLEKDVERYPVPKLS